MSWSSLATRVRSDVQVFTLDTGLFFPETYDLMHKVERRYGITIERVKPVLSVDEQAAQHGPSLWQHSPDRCCYMRKIEPLRRKLSTLDAWVAAIRRDQTPDRAHAQKVPAAQLIAKVSARTPEGQHGCAP